MKPEQNPLSKLDQINDEFESALRDGHPIPIESVLPKVDLQQQDELFRHLLGVEMEYRYGSADSSGVADYRRRFPDYCEIINEVALRCANLETVVGTASPTTEPAIGTVQRTIGPYHLQKQIGAGGMGEVWLAEQTEPVRRRVALKLIKGGMDSQQVIARFEAERQALAMMSHPNIATVFDAGQSDDGLPYVVMEYVDGEPITGYCDRLRLSIADRMRLMTSVCDAVQHAHQKGILHRDLKPSNVMVAEIEGRPIAKVIDFGLAKATEPQNHLTDKTLFTEFGQVVGTLLYMSPEQADASPLGVDTRADIYSLGVMLYELLTGTTPLPQEFVKQETLLKVLERIRDTEPPRPSTRLSESGDRIDSVSAARQIGAQRLGQILKGDLDWIVMKSLAKERERRYDSAASLGDDVRLYLDGDAIEARPPSTVYQTTKFIRRNRLLVGSAIATSFLLIAGISGTTWFAIRSNQDRARADEQAERARQQSQLAFETLSAVIDDLHNGIADFPGSDQIRRKILETSLEKIELIAKENIDEDVLSLSNVALLHNLGHNLDRFGSTDQKALTVARDFHNRGHQLAKRLAQRYPNDLKTQSAYASSCQMLADVVISQGEFDYGSSLHHRAVELRKHVLSLDPANRKSTYWLALAYNRVGDMHMGRGENQESIASFQQAVDLCSLPKSRADLRFAAGQALTKMGEGFVLLGEIQSARESYEIARDFLAPLYEDEPDSFTISIQYAYALDGCANTLRDLDLVKQSSDSCEKALKIAEELYRSSPTSIDVTRILTNNWCHRAQIKWKQGKPDEALRQFKQLIDFVDDGRPLFDIERGALLRLRDALIGSGEICGVKGRFGESIPFLVRSIQAHETIVKGTGWVPSDGLLEVQVHSDLCHAHHSLGNSSAAIESAKQAIASHDSLPYPMVDIRPSQHARALSGLARALSETGMEDELELCLKQLSQVTSRLPIQQLVAIVWHLGRLHESVGDKRSEMEVHVQLGDAATIGSVRYVAGLAQKLGLEALGNGNLEQARDDFELAHKYRQRAMDVEPENADSYSSSAWLAGSFGRLETLEKNNDEAIDWYERAIDYRRKLLDLMAESPEPEIKLARKRLAESIRDLSNCLRQRGSPDDLAKSAKLLRQAREVYPESSGYTGEDGWNALREADRLAKEGQRDASLAMYRKGVEIMTAVHTETPNDTNARAKAILLWLLGKSLQESQQYADSIEPIEQSIQIIDSLASEVRENLLTDLVQASRLLAIAYQETKQFQSAERLFQSASKVRAEIDESGVEVKTWIPKLKDLDPQAKRLGNQSHRDAGEIGHYERDGCRRVSVIRSTCLSSCLNRIDGSIAATPRSHPNLLP
ncbi:MAG: protein kinase [Rubripirellula sp.]